MDKIEVKVLNPEAIKTAEQMMVCAARLTQRGQNINCLQDFLDLYNKSYKESTADIMNHLPHDTIKRFGTVNVVITGASRRFLAQITRTQVGVTFTSASLQYGDYSGKAKYTVPYSIIEKGEEEINKYLETCEKSMVEYEKMIAEDGVDNDAAGYMAPQGLRNVLIIGANITAWQHIISQRACSRNTKETQYVMLKIWEALYEINPIMFSPDTTGPFCMKGPCKEGKFSCGKPITKGMTPTDILKREYPLLMKGDKNENYIN